MTDALTEPMTRENLLAMAKTRAGFGQVDSPCEPRRSSYTDDRAGDYAYRAAVIRWFNYRALLTCNLHVGLLTAQDFWVLRTCRHCLFVDGEHAPTCTKPERVPSGFLTADQAAGHRAVLGIRLSNERPTR